jgi:hypothetical protein
MTNSAPYGILHPYSVFLHVPEARLGGESGSEHVLLDMILTYGPAAELAYCNRFLSTCNTLHLIFPKSSYYLEGKGDGQKEYLAAFLML